MYREFYVFMVNVQSNNDNRNIIILLLLLLQHRRFLVFKRLILNPFPHSRIKIGSKYLCSQ